VETLHHIHISKYLNSSPRKNLFSLLEILLPVRFYFKEQVEIEPAGKIILEDMVNLDEVVNSKDISSLSAPLQGSHVNHDQKVQIEVKFADNLDIPIPFRGRKLITNVKGIGSFLSLRKNEKILAECQQGPIWSLTDEGGVKHFRSCLPFPQISAYKNFSDVFNGERFLEMIPLIHFLHEVSGNTIYKNPPLRAAYIIDDPNLHWPKYGYVDYNKIALHAKRENYHVCFATIPLDTWFTHAATADLFRRNSQWLSLVVHGNNHAKAELARKYSRSARTALLKQAIQRMKLLEDKTNLRFCRVIVPPHGACSEDMLTEIKRCGFESVCISSGSLRAYNREKSWTKTLGFFPSEVIEGVPVLPRSGLTGSVENKLLIASYLGQPMILRGHHYDLKDGVEVLDGIAKFINGMGNVLWLNMTNLSRLNYLWRMEGGTYRVKPLGRKIVIQLPGETTKVMIEGFSTTDEGVWRTYSADGFYSKIKTGEQFRLPDSVSRKIFIERAELQELDLAIVKPNATSAWLILRRLLTEARDRLSCLSIYKKPC
jgi:hypothetical protein